MVTDDGEIRANVVASQAELHARYGGVVPEIASRRHLELVSPVVARGTRRGGRDARRRRRGRGHARAGADRRAARRLVGGEGARLGAAAAARPVDHLHGHVASLYLAARPARAAVPLPARERRAHAAARRAGPRRLRASSARRSTTRRARRSTRARACSGSATPAARRSTGSRATATRRRTTFPVARVPGLDFSFSGAQDRAAVRRRATSRRTSSSARRADLAACTSARSCGRSSARVARPAQTGATRIASSAASPRTPSSARRSPTPPPRRSPLCTDNAAMIASAARFAEPVAVPRLSWPRCVRLAREPRRCSLLALVAVAARPCVRRGRRRRGQPRRAGRAPPAGSGLVGYPRPRVAPGQRVHRRARRRPSLAHRVAPPAASSATGEERRWTATALAAQKLLVSRLARAGRRRAAGLTASRAC